MIENGICECQLPTGEEFGWRETISCVRGKQLELRRRRRRATLLFQSELNVLQDTDTFFFFNA